MREMRDSGVEWIGEIPKDWNCCKQKYRFNKIRKDTVLENYPLYCPKCRQERLIKVDNLKITVIKEPDA